MGRSSDDDDDVRPGADMNIDCKRLWTTGWRVVDTRSVMHDVNRPRQHWVSYVNHNKTGLREPFQSDSHPSFEDLATRFIIPHTPSAAATGMRYSGRVPSSSTERLTT